MRVYISGKKFDEERALYNLQDAQIENCVFAGPADGESALKESRNIIVKNCSFSLRYPFWHVRKFAVESCFLDEFTRAPVWYAFDGVFNDCTINGIKCLRECKKMHFNNCNIVSPEFGWRCDDISITDCDVTSEYFLFESKNINIEHINMKGKYSFQYVENMNIECSELDTKDAFWHSKNVTVRNSTVKGEYLGWYSDGLKLENCRIIGTQPLCYCKNLKLLNCTMEGADLSFEYSAVEADVSGNILSVKNPLSGSITADGIGEVILENSIVESTCKISVRGSV